MKSTRTVHIRPIVTVAASACAALLLGGLGACGGGDPWPDTAPQVALEGCVVGTGHVPMAGQQVQVFGAGGELVGQAISGADGNFVLQVPRESALTVVTAGDRTSVRTGAHDHWLSYCLGNPWG